MTGYLHRKITFEACREAGFDMKDSEKLAGFSESFDSIGFLKPFAHFSRFGARFFGHAFFRLAIVSGNLRFLGYSFHCIQDAISHGNIYPWQHNRYRHLDRLEDEETRRKVYEATLNMAGEYLAARENG